MKGVIQEVSTLKQTQAYNRLWKQVKHQSCRKVKDQVFTQAMNQMYDQVYDQVFIQVVDWMCNQGRGEL